MSETPEFKEKMKELLKKAEEELVIADKELKKAKLSGIDVSTVQERYDSRVSQLKRIKDVYLS
ncbi:MAG: hypothetical protein ACFE9S_19105 [Candidatus Hermodarchaeota archaeon]